MPKIHWSDCPGAVSERGWLKALCEPLDFDKFRAYTHENMPVMDIDVPGGWREQSTLGNYIDYGPVRGDKPDTAETIHCICYATKTTRWVATVAAAKAWIESEAKRGRPELFPEPEPHAGMMTRELFDYLMAGSDEAR